MLDGRLSTQRARRQRVGTSLRVRPVRWHQSSMSASPLPKAGRQRPLRYSPIAPRVRPEAVQTCLPLMPARRRSSRNSMKSTGGGNANRAMDADDEGLGCWNHGLKRSLPLGVWSTLCSQRSCAHRGENVPRGSFQHQPCLIECQGFMSAGFRHPCKPSTISTGFVDVTWWNAGRSISIRQSAALMMSNRRASICFECVPITI